MTTPRILPVGLGMVYAVLCAGCVPSLSSVRSTAALGQQIRAYDDVFLRAATYCGLSNFTTDADPMCAQLRADGANWRLVNETIVAYATALAQMADDDADKSQADNIDGMLASVGKLGPWAGQISADQAAKVSSGADALIHAITGVYRRERLGRTIRGSAKPLRDVIQGVEANIKLIDAAEANLQQVISSTAESIKDGSASLPQKQAHVMTLLSLDAEMTDYRVRLANYGRVLKAFCLAHDRLTAGLNGLGDRKADAEVLKLIASDVATAYKDFDTVAASTPVAGGGP